MRVLELACSWVAVWFLLAFSWPAEPRRLAYLPGMWHERPRPAARCGAALVIVATLADPAHAPDATGELVRLRNLEPEPVVLTGWALERGAARRALDDVVVGPGEALDLMGGALRPVRLPNAGGELVLVDPCGITTRFTWPRAEPGHLELAELEAAGAM